MVSFAGTVHVKIFWVKSSLKWAIAILLSLPKCCVEYLPMHVCAPPVCINLEGKKGHHNSWNWSWFWAATWILGIETRFSGRIASSLNFWAIYLSRWTILKKWFLRQRVYAWKSAGSQAWKHHFYHHFPCIIPVLGRQSCVGAWGSLASQSNQMSEI